MTCLLLRQDPIFASRFLLNSLSEMGSIYNVHMVDLRERIQLRMDFSSVSRKMRACEVRMGSDMFSLLALGLCVPPEYQEEYDTIVQEARAVVFLCGLNA